MFVANAYSDTTALSNIVKAAYDLAVRPYLRSDPVFRQIIDVKPIRQAMPGSSVVINIGKGFANLATTALTENVTPDSVAIQNTTPVTITLNTYGNWTQESWEVNQTAFAAVDPLIAKAIADNMVDTIDAKVRVVMDGASKKIMRTGATTPTSVSAVPGSVTSASVINGATVSLATALLRTDLAPAFGGGNGGGVYGSIIHPHVAADLRNETGTAAWITPHNYVDTANIYNAEIGTYAGVRFMESPRATTATDGASSAVVYRTYVFGREAVAEAATPEGQPQIVLGPITDPLLRERPFGWKALMGWSLFRPESLRVVLTSSSLAGMV